MPENFNDPAYKDQAFEAARARYRQSGAGLGITIETDKAGKPEPVDKDKNFEDAKRKFGKSKNNVVSMKDQKYIKPVDANTNGVFAISDPNQGA